MLERILLPLDGSLFSEQALHVAARIAWRANAELHLVKVRPLATGLLSADPQAAAATLQRESAGDREYLERVAARLRAPGRRVHTNVLTGTPTIALSGYVTDTQIDLVVMTTHGRGGLSRAWLGSVADRLVRTTSVPVLLLRPRDGAGLARDLKLVQPH